MVSLNLPKKRNTRKSVLLLLWPNEPLSIQIHMQTRALWSAYDKWYVHTLHL